MTEISVLAEHLWKVFNYSDLRICKAADKHGEFRADDCNNWRRDPVG